MKVELRVMLRKESLQLSRWIVLYLLHVDLLVAAVALVWVVGII